MCIIYAKPRKVAPVSREVFERMLNANPHGFAIAVSPPKGGAWKIFRTLDRGKALAQLLKVSAEEALIMHARIATHGSRTRENCHGWRDARSGISFFHNGVLGIKNEHDKTDSETFFRRIFAPLYAAGKWRLAAPAVNAVLNHTSKFAFALPSGAMRLFGNFIEEGGAYFSNDSFRPASSRWRSYFDEMPERRNASPAAAKKTEPPKAFRRTRGGFSETWDRLPATCEAPF